MNKNKQPNKVRTTPLPLFVAARVLVAGGLVLLIILSIRSAISFTKPLPEVIPYEGVAAVDTGPGNQFLFNGGLMELDVGESEEDTEELISELVKDCEPSSIDIDRHEQGALISCRPKTEDVSDAFNELAGELPTVAWIQKEEEGGKATYMKLSPKERISIDSLVPQDGDAPGFDIEGLPRIPGMDRWMSFSDPSGGYRSVFYGRGPGTPLATLHALVSSLPAEGWSIVQTEEAADGPFVFATGHGQLVMIRVSPGCNEVCASVMATPL